MDYKKESKYRDQILARARRGDRITPDERLWLLTHRLYNHALGYPYLNTDIIDLQTDKECTVYVKIESISYDDRIIPVINVPGGTGKIVSENIVTDYKGDAQHKKPVKMLGLLLNMQHKETRFLYQSNLGLLGVSYECDYIDEKQKIKIRQNSGTGCTNLAMLCERISANRLLYRCKNPQNVSFDSLVFSVRW